MLLLVIMVQGNDQEIMHGCIQKFMAILLHDNHLLHLGKPHNIIMECYVIDIEM